MNNYHKQIFIPYADDPESGYNKCAQEESHGNCMKHDSHFYLPVSVWPGHSSLGEEAHPILREKYLAQEPIDWDSPAFEGLGGKWDREENPTPPDHMAPVTPIWDAKSIRSRQFPKE